MFSICYERDLAERFAAASGDFHPAHLSAHRPILHGALAVLSSLREVDAGIASLDFFFASPIYFAHPYRVESRYLDNRAVLLRILCAEQVIVGGQVGLGNEGQASQATSEPLIEYCPRLDVLRELSDELSIHPTVATDPLLVALAFCSYALGMRETRMGTMCGLSLKMTGHTAGGSMMHSSFLRARGGIEGHLMCGNLLLAWWRLKAKPGPTHPKT